MIGFKTIGQELAKALGVLAIVFLSFGHQNPPGLIGANGLPAISGANCGTPLPQGPPSGGEHEHGCPVHHVSSGYTPALPPTLPVPLSLALLARIVPADTSATPSHFRDWSVTPRAPPLV